jgi:hypothetical protein
VVKNFTNGFVGYFDGKFMELVSDTAGTPEGVLFFKTQDEFFDRSGDGFSTRAFVGVGLAFCQEVFPDREDGPGRDGGKETGRIFGQGKENMDRVFFMGLERVSDMAFFKVPAVKTDFEQEKGYFGEGRVL